MAPVLRGGLVAERLSPALGRELVDEAVGMGRDAQEDVFEILEGASWSEVVVDHTTGMLMRRAAI
jgi:hypothetical protein